MTVRRDTGIGAMVADLRPKKTRRAPARVEPPAQTPAPAGRAVRATFHLPAELVEQAKNAVVALSGPPVRLTLAALVRSALERELARLQDEHHKGKPWPQRSAPLVGGRPMKS